MAALPFRPASAFVDAASRLLRSRTGSAAIAGLAILCALAILAPLLSPQNPYDLAQLDVVNGRLPPGTQAGSGTIFVLGTDEQGRDLLSAILYGLRVSLVVGLTGTAIAFAVGTLAGLLAAWTGGAAEALLMRLADLQLSFPSILVALVLLAVAGQGADKVIVALVVAQWAYFARSVRSAAVVEMSREYIEAARGLGLPARRIVLRHLLPNCLPPVIVVATVQAAAAINLEATLSFLGLGVPITRPSLGLLIANGFQYLMAGQYWISLFPGIALVALIVCVNAAGEALREALNPRSQGREAGAGPALDRAPPAAAASASARPGPQTAGGAPRLEDSAVPLSVDGLRVVFETARGPFTAVDGISFGVPAGRILGLVGESGSGKSVTALSLLRLLEPPARITAGEVKLGGRDVLQRPAAELPALRGRRIAMIFQDPTSSLNPVLRIETQMVEAIRAHRPVSRRAAVEQARDALASVGIAAPARRLRAYPHELSGGMRQRVVIAIAMLNSPEVLVADEPTTALDVTIQAQIAAIVQELTRERNLAVVWITHDLELIAGLADSLCVMQAGRIVEEGPVDAVLDRPRHPYTQALLKSVLATSAAGPGDLPPPRFVTGSAADSSGTLS